jgi:hypothetical protein
MPVDAADTATGDENQLRRLLLWYGNEALPVLTYEEVVEDLRAAACVSSEHQDDCGGPEPVNVYLNYKKSIIVATYASEDDATAVERGVSSAIASRAGGNNGASIYDGLKSVRRVQATRHASVSMPAAAPAPAPNKTLKSAGAGLASGGRGYMIGYITGERDAIKRSYDALLGASQIICQNAYGGVCALLKTLSDECVAKSVQLQQLTADEGGSGGRDWPRTNDLIANNKLINRNNYTANSNNINKKHKRIYEEDHDNDSDNDRRRFRKSARDHCDSAKNREKYEDNPFFPKTRHQHTKNTTTPTSIMYNYHHHNPNSHMRRDDDGAVLYEGLI